MGRPVSTWTLDMIGRLVGLSDAGRTDKDIAAELGVSAQSVAVKRHRLGLRKSPAARSAVAREKGTHLRPQAARRKLLADRGWPETLPLRGAQIVEFLCDFGPATARQLTAALGLPRECKDRRGGRTIFSALQAAGLVHKVYGVLGSWRTAAYFPTAGALQIRRAFLERQGAP